MKKSKLSTVLLSVNLSVFIISFSIAVVILCRPFYYMHINLYNLEQQSGFNREEIITAYDEMLDFCIGKSDEFSTGVMRYSEEGKAHFVDCVFLFKLDFWLAGISGAILILFLVLEKKEIVSIPYIYGHGYLYYGPIFTAVIFLIIGFVAALDFDQFFVIFHHVLFPGKDNWMFSSYYDQIINVLPEEYFANCGIFIVVLIVILCTVCIRKDKKTFIHEK